jgi:hypothetical protein
MSGSANSLRESYLRRARKINPSPVAGTAQPFVQLDSSAIVQGSWEGTGSFTTTRSFRDKNTLRKYLVDLLLIPGHCKHAEKERLSLR